MVCTAAVRLQGQHPACRASTRSPPGIGWFAVNSVSGALALNTLTGLPKWLCLVIVVAAQIVIAFFGHNFVQAFERYRLPLLAVSFVLGAVYRRGQVRTLGRDGRAAVASAASCSRSARRSGTPPAGTRTPRDYTRYLRPDATGGRSASGRASACSCPA